MAAPPAVQRPPTPDYLTVGDVSDGLQEDLVSEDEDTDPHMEEREPRNERERLNHRKIRGYLGAEPRKGFTGDVKKLGKRDVVFVILWEIMDDDDEYYNGFVLERVNWHEARTTWQFSYHFAWQQWTYCRRNWGTRSAEKRAEERRTGSHRLHSIVDWAWNWNTGDTPRLEYLVRWVVDDPCPEGTQTWLWYWIIPHNVLWRDDSRVAILDFWRDQDEEYWPMFLWERIIALPPKESAEYARDSGFDEEPYQ